VVKRPVCRGRGYLRRGNHIIQSWRVFASIFAASINMGGVVAWRGGVAYRGAGVGDRSGGEQYLLL